MRKSALIIASIIAVVSLLTWSLLRNYLDILNQVTIAGLICAFTVMIIPVVIETIRMKIVPSANIKIHTERYRSLLIYMRNGVMLIGINVTLSILKEYNDAVIQVSAGGLAIMFVLILGIIALTTASAWAYQRDISRCSKCLETIDI